MSSSRLDTRCAVQYGVSVAIAAEETELLKSTTFIHSNDQLLFDCALEQLQCRIPAQLFEHFVERRTRSGI